VSRRQPGQRDLFSDQLGTGLDSDFDRRFRQHVYAEQVASYGRTLVAEASRLRVTVADPRLQHEDLAAVRHALAGQLAQLAAAVAEASALVDQGGR